MAQRTQLIHHYLRHNKKFPHVYCPGCGHGIALGSLIRSVHALELSKDEVVLVAGIGCSGRMAVYVDFNTVHAVHGRALTIATGIKLASPHLKVIVVMGDGDALSMGGNHFIHAARRNLGLSVLVLNNNIYGMTGGQCSCTTPRGALSATTPYGQMEKSFDLAQLAAAAGANYVARASAFHAQGMDKLMQATIAHRGFSLLEVVSPCHTQYGRKNRFKTVVDMYRWLRDAALPLEQHRKLPPDKAADRIPLGVFVDNDEPALEERYAELRASQAEGRP